MGHKASSLNTRTRKPPLKLELEQEQRNDFVYVNRNQETLDKALSRAADKEPKIPGRSIFFGALMLAEMK